MRTDRSRIIPKRENWEFVATLSLAVIIAYLPSGCGERDDRERLSTQAIKLEDVPKNVLDAAKKTFPDVEFTEVWKNSEKDRSVHSYEIRGKVRATGKIREARVSPSGEILETE